MDRSTLYNVDNLKTGDIILFSGSSFVSHIIRLLTKSKWSHIGMIVIDPEFPYPLIYESSHHNGVRILSFNERRREFDGDMALRRLNCGLSDKDLYHLSIFRKHMVGTPFEKSRLQMLASVFHHMILPNREDLSSVFCSELVAQCYQELGLLGQDRPSNKYSPADFTAERNLPLIRGKLGPQINIKEYRK